MKNPPGGTGILYNLKLCKVTKNSLIQTIFHNAAEENVHLGLANTDQD